MLELEIRASSPRRLQFGPDRTVTIGRDSECVIPIDDTSASRVHCVVTYRGGHWLLRDADSRNGTKVNLDSVHSRALRDGDVIHVGHTEIEVHLALLARAPAPIAALSSVGLPASVEVPATVATPALVATPATDAAPSTVPAGAAREPADSDATTVTLPLPRLAKRLWSPALSFTPAYPMELAAPMPAAVVRVTPLPSPRRATPTPPTSSPIASPIPSPMALAPSAGPVAPSSPTPPTPASPVSPASPTSQSPASPSTPEFLGSPSPAHPVAPASLTPPFPADPAPSTPPAPVAPPAATPPASPRRRRSVARAPAWALSLAVHAAGLFLLSCIVVSYQWITAPDTFTVGLSAFDANLGRKALESRRPEPSDDPVRDLQDAYEREDVPVPATSRLERPAKAVAMSTWASVEPLHATSGFVPTRVGGKRGARDFVAEIGDPGRREAIENALRWLSRHQNTDGPWAAAGFAEMCGDPACVGPGKPIHDAGVTGLAILAFLGAGYTQGDGTYGPEIRAALQWLAAGQAPDGALAPPRGKFLYSHSIATAALCQAFALKRTPALRAPAERAVRFLLAAQSPAGGWRYKPGEAESDTSVTGWAVIALVHARRAGFDVPNETFFRVLDFLRSVNDVNGHFGYQSPLDLGSRPEDGLDKFPPREATTAIGTVCRLLCTPEGAPATDPAALGLILGQRPSWGAEGEEADMIAWLFGSVALSRVAHKDKADWLSDLARVSLEHQVTDGCAQGSWPVAGPWATSGGRIYTTAVAALALEAEGGGLLAGLPGTARPVKPGRRK